MYFQFPLFNSFRIRPTYCLPLPPPWTLIVSGLHLEAYNFLMKYVAQARFSMTGECKRMKELRMSSSKLGGFIQSLSRMIEQPWLAKEEYVNLWITSLIRCTSTRTKKQGCSGYTKTTRACANSV